MRLSHKKIITVTHENLDAMNHVNNVQYVHWVEEIAAEHWNIVKDNTPYYNDYWVLVDHHITYKKQVFLGDELTVCTYPLPPEGIRQPRKVVFFVNGEKVVDSRTIWVLFEGTSQRITRIAEDWLERLEEKLKA